ncbi:ATP-binding protein [Variovorax sp. J22R133]|uniref:ATP-binding protein n=1 Tax=Variovorax brevis TaxID=3053503 RepID=UPI00257662F9|nr:ATP-binding protein [Variovorax sp. J22R133]MDM0117938.1 ATP-binding protein [Variovorax sp. J22R133]
MTAQALSIAPARASTQELLRFERLLSEVSAAFLHLPAKHVDRAIDESLARIVATLGIDRSTLNRVFLQNGRIETTHSFALEGVPPVPRLLAARDTNPWALSQSLANRSIVFTHLDELPPEASQDKEHWRQIGLKSHVMMPIVVGGQLYGSLNFGCVRAHRSWPEELVARMRLMGDIFGNALARKLTQEELDLTIIFERIASTILAALVLARPGDESAVIDRGLRQIGEFVLAERVALWQRTPDGDHFSATHHWNAQGFAAPAGFGVTNRLPWMNAQISAGRSVRLARLAELPAEACVDLATLRELGLRSVLLVPIAMAGVYVGALSIASIQRENEWPDALLPGVTLLAEVFASVHARLAAERQKLAAEVEAAHWRERLAHLVRVHTAGEMSVALAHEITQPLGAIENYALAARRRAAASMPDLPRVVDLLDKVIGQATRAGDVVSRMRSMTQRHELDVKPIDVERAIVECIGMVRMDCELRDIRILLNASGPRPVVVADEIHLQQVMLNLLRNAVEATEMGQATVREITVTIAIRHGNEVLVEVADRGIGIAVGDLERVFEAFFSTKSSGLGVGLAICRKLIEAHGGKLWASQHEGGGALFSLTLPVAPHAG